MNKKKKIITIVVIILLAGVGAGLYYSHVNNNKKLIGNTKTNPGPKTSAANDKKHDEVVSNSFSKGGATDNKGGSGSTVSTDPSSWAMSSSGNITLQQPLSQQKFSPGDTFSGTAKVSNVSYRLIDDSAGVIAQGDLAVVNGKFSGTMQFSPKSNTGSLKIYSVNSNTDAEENHTDIKVNF